MKMQTKRWIINYAHDDGRRGTVCAMTNVFVHKDGRYGEGGIKVKLGFIDIEDDEYKAMYDLRYEQNDPHMTMIKEYFGKGLKTADEI